MTDTNTFRDMIVTILTRGDAFLDKDSANNKKAAAEQTADEIIIRFADRLPWAKGYVSEIKIKDSRKNSLEKFSTTELIEELTRRGVKFYIE